MSQAVVNIHPHQATQFVFALKLGSIVVGWSLPQWSQSFFD